jgi:hypothetical protein
MTRILFNALAGAALLTASTAASAQGRWHGGGDHDWHHGDGDWHHGDHDWRRGDWHHHWRGWDGWGAWGGWGGWSNWGGWGGWGGWGYPGSYVSIGWYPYSYGYYPGYAGYAYPIYGYPGYPTGYLRYDFGGRRDWDRRDRWRERCRDDRDGRRWC